MNKSSRTARYVVQSEPTPVPKPRWWRSIYFVIDRAASNRSVVKRFAAWGEADRYARCLNQPSWITCGNAGPASSQMRAAS